MKAAGAVVPNNTERLRRPCDAGQVDGEFLAGTAPAGAIHNRNAFQVQGLTATGAGVLFQSPKGPERESPFE
jgi:hypothetical protein